MLKITLVRALFSFPVEKIATLVAMTQAEALTILKTGANVFLTGEPGSGKTHTINQYVKYLQSCGVEPAITASTGIASTHIGGVTIHAWSGIGIKEEITEQDIEMIGEKERVVRRVTNAKVLIIDEISMLSAETLSSVDAVCRALRHSHEPFGGLQVVFVGDFFQLPPIEKRRHSSLEDQIDFDGNRGGNEVRFAFRSSVWRKMNPFVCYLSEQHRQEDGVYLSALGAIRRGEVTDEIRGHLAKRAKVDISKETLTKLFPHNADVDKINDAELEKLPGAVRMFRMDGSGAPPLIEGLKRSCLSPENLGLKVGAKVMFTKNSMEGDFVNGTTGEIIEFSKVNGYPVVKTRNGKVIEAEPLEWAIQDNGRTIAKIAQIPLRLAWAITVHKSQGMSLDAAVIDLRSAFEFGQGYVALSRVRTLEGLHLLGFNERALEVHPDVSAQDADFRARSDDVREVFEKMDAKEITLLQDNFIKAIGGTKGVGRVARPDKKTGSTYDITHALVLKKMPLKDIAGERGMTLGTIISHLEKLVAEKRLDPESNLIYLKPDAGRFKKMKEAFEKVRAKEGKMPLSPVHQSLRGAFDFDELRLARLFL